MNLLDAFNSGMTEEEKQYLRMAATQDKSLLRKADDALLGVSNVVEAGGQPRTASPMVGDAWRNQSSDYPKGRVLATTPTKVMQNPTASPDVKAPTYRGYGAGADAATQNWRGSTEKPITDKPATVEQINKIPSMPTVKSDGQVDLEWDKFLQQYDKPMPELTAGETQLAQKETIETAQEIQQASQDPDMWKQFTDKLGVAGDEAWKQIKDASGRVDWLTAIVVGVASASTGSNVAKAVSNGLIRGIEAKTMQNQRATQNKIAQQKNLLEAQSDADESELDWFKARTERQRAGDYGKYVTNQGKGKDSTEEVPDLSANERAVVKGMPDSFTPDVWNQAAMELKKRGKPIDPVSMKKVATMLQEKGIVSDDWFGADSLV